MLITLWGLYIKELEALSSYNHKPEAKSEFWVCVWEVQPNVCVSCPRAGGCSPDGSPSTWLG